MTVARRVVFTCALLVTGNAVAAPSTAPVASAQHFVDGTRVVTVERTGTAYVDELGRRLTPVRLHYAHRATVVTAHVGKTAIVKLEPFADPGALGIVVERALMPSAGLWLVSDAEGGDGLDVAERLSAPLARSHGVQLAAPDLYLEVAAKADPFVPDDPRLPGQWYFEQLRMTEAWGLTRGSASTTIVVIDTGCDASHPDLATKLDPGRDVIDLDDDPSPDPAMLGAAHGTSCAGLVGAATDNAIGMAGGCPECRVRCVRLITDSLQPVSASVDAFQFALDVDAAVVSNSWGYVDPTPVPAGLKAAISEVHQNGRGGLGALVLFAAGNDDRTIGDDELQAAPGVLNVGAVNHFDEQTPFTNSGASLDLVAYTGTLTLDLTGPAGDDPGDYTSLFGGTSSACPVAAGIAGLLVSAAPERTAAELYEVMIRTSRPAPYAVPDDNGHDAVYGYGIVDPVAALRDVMGLPPEVDAGPEPAKPTAPAEAGDSSGCACRTGGRSAPPSMPLAIGLLAVAAAWLRRTRR